MRVIREGVGRGEGDDLRSLPPTELFDFHNDFILNAKLYNKYYVCRKQQDAARRRALEGEAGPLRGGKGKGVRRKRG
jgi:hypothetical protein